MRVYGVAGWKNSGKTTLMARLLTEMTLRGYVVSTVKHAHHATETDHPGTDSHRHRTAGARQVLVASPVRWALMTELRGDPEPPLADLLAQLAPVDLVLVEGFKTAPHPKIETHRAQALHPLMAHKNLTIRGVAADTPVAGLRIPVFDLNDTATITDFILREVGL